MANWRRLPGDGTKVLVDDPPPCDINPDHGPAKFDAKSAAGPWAYMCDDCFRVHGVGLGTGLGQEIIVRRGKS